VERFGGPEGEPSHYCGFTYFSLLGEGDEILLPDPTYPPYITYAKMLGAKPVLYRCREEEGWSPSEEDIRRKITPRTRAIALINPNNPTGALYDERTVKLIGDIAWWRSGMG